MNFSVWWSTKVQNKHKIEIWKILSDPFFVRFHETWYQLQSCLQTAFSIEPWTSPSYDLQKLIENTKIWKITIYISITDHIPQQLLKLYFSEHSTNRFYLVDSKILPIWHTDSRSGTRTDRIRDLRGKTDRKSEIDIERDDLKNQWEKISRNGDFQRNRGD